jgi:uncharacterized membrane protein HdeD (DUF308 family)
MYRPGTATSVFFGILAIIIGIMALAWPGVTILSLVLLFAIYAFARGFTQAGIAFRSRKAGSVLGHIILALVDVAAGLFAVAWPAPTALVLVLLVGFWAIVGGFWEFFAAFRSGEMAGTRALFIIGGLVSVVFGAAVLSRPSIGAVTVALLFGYFALIYGVWQIVTGIELRNRRSA